MRDKPVILYVEDNPASATLIERILGAFGYQVIIATTGFAGFEAAITHQPDLILLDIDLPDITGFEVAMRLRDLEDFRHTPFIAVTATYDVEYRNLARLSGISSYVTKPVNVDNLASKIESYLSQEKDNLDVEFDLDDENAVYDYHTVKILVQKLREVQAANEELTQNNRELVENLVSKLRTAEEANAELRRLDKLKDDFIQRIAHELRTPLTIVVGYNDIVNSTPSLNRALAADKSLGEVMQGLSVAIDRMCRVVDEIVLTTRLATGKVDVRPSNIAPRELVQRLLMNFVAACQQRNITLTLTDVERWPPLVHVDPDLMGLAISNIVGNAIKYTPDGGAVSIDVTQLGKRVRFSITDTGIGINRNEQKRIFDRFYSAHDIELHSTSKTAFMGAGPGLGLAIAKTIVEAHRGSIRVESKGMDSVKCLGSTFYVEVPLYLNETDTASLELNERL